ncbi:hypothetical protein HHI36_011105 [Cryptolaemus montrouzieri]|uniref:Uncharacterized protein n=1 Tax=Cryptolaemus montrouzieri TaxID=559131 RepID=A0ABD2MKN3_9CUCU
MVFLLLLMSWLPILILCSIIYSNHGALYEDDNCRNTNPKGATRGKCMSAYNCPWALEQIQQRHHVDFCCFNGKIPVICCPLNNTITGNEVPREPIISTESPKIPASGLTSMKGNSNPGSKSAAKCLEYYPQPPPGISFTAAVGGKESLAAEFPHMAILGYGTDDDKQWKCGGSLISKQHVLTAAHCLYSRDLGDVKYVRLGDLNLNIDTDDAEPQDFIVTQAIAHPDYESRLIKNDIAILVLDRPVKVTTYVKPACLQTTKNLEDTVITATGWGLTEFAGGFWRSTSTCNIQKWETLLHNWCNIIWKSLWRY